MTNAVLSPKCGWHAQTVGMFKSKKRIHLWCICYLHLFIIPEWQSSIAPEVWRSCYGSSLFYLYTAALGCLSVLCMKQKFCTNKSLGISKNIWLYPCLRETGIYLLCPQKLLPKSPITSKRLKLMSVSGRTISHSCQRSLCAVWSLLPWAALWKWIPHSCASSPRKDVTHKLCPWRKFDKKTFTKLIWIWFMLYFAFIFWLIFGES